MRRLDTTLGKTSSWESRRRCLRETSKQETGDMRTRREGIRKAGGAEFVREMRGASISSVMIVVKEMSTCEHRWKPGVT